MIFHPTIVDYRTICPFWNNKFDKKRLSMSRLAILKSSQTALLLVHPLSSLSYLKTPERLSFNHFLQQKINISNYGEYLARLRTYLASDSMHPTFIFYQKDDKIRTMRWIKSIAPKNIVITVESEPGDGTPVIPSTYHLVPAWKVFAESVLSLGISDILIGGELAYEVGNDEAKEKVGCVYRVSETLENYLNTDYFGKSNFIKKTTLSEFSFNISLFDHLAYPNISVPKHSSK